MGDGAEGEEENGADLIPRCQSRSKGREAKKCEQEHFELALLFQQMRRELLLMF